ncbi:hypothetical protein Ndes2437B_g06106 [Nannochloris sp. 'desiccata']|nr:hypothetical protein KSW81_008049 [Chlorella desiccata (nom. nud.)]
MEGELGAVNGMVDDSDVQVGNENIGGIMGEEAAEGAAGLNASSGDGVDGEEPTGEVRQERVVVKFLIPNAAAGSIIGKGGAHISEIQTQSGARMQLSKSGEFYPGSMEGQDRILLVSGTVDQLLTALHLVLSKLMSEPTALQSVQSKEGDKLQLRMLVHTRLCGTLIGKGGATIRSFNEDSHAAFNISPPPSLPGLTERVVRISGDLDGLMRAVALVVTKLSENPDYHLLTDANLSYSARFGGGHSGGGGGRYGGDDRQMGGHSSGAGGAGGFGVHTTTMTLAIPEDRVGMVIGKQGAVINQIKDLVKVSIRISKRGEHLPGTNDRACEITGAPDAVELAQRLIMQRLVGRN